LQQLHAVVGHYRSAALVEHLAEAIDGCRDGELDAFDVDQVLFQWSRAAKELWKFCITTDIEFTAKLVQERPPLEWWERGAGSQEQEEVSAAAPPVQPARSLVGPEIESFRELAADEHIC
jgi:hypothetical protein